MEIKSIVTETLNHLIYTVVLLVREKVPALTYFLTVNLSVTQQHLSVKSQVNVVCSKAGIRLVMYRDSSSGVQNFDNYNLKQTYSHY